ncbi:MAG: hypothetical protein IKP25_07200 [Ruminococcus sp.]|nr:hypothetical protein [Ruminococcus sp.]
MALFNKKKKQEEEASAAVNEMEFDYKEAVLKALDEKLNGSTLYDGCIIMPRGFTIDVKIGRRDEKDGIKLVQVVFLVSHDDFDEPIIDPVDAQGKDEAEAVHMAVEIFYGGLWHPLDQSMFKKSPIEVSAQFLGQHYTYDMYAQSIVRIGVQDKEPTMLVGFLQNEIPKYLGSKKYYWLRIYLAKHKDRQIIEVRVNGSVCNELGEKFRPYVDAWDASEHFICEKQYAIFVQRGDDPCPYKKEVYTNAAKFAIEKMVKIKNREDYEAMADELVKVAGDKAVASEIRIFIPEILAKLTLGYQEGDSLFLIEGDENSEEGTSKIEFRKTQLRSYFYLQQVILEYLNTRPPQEDVQNIVFNSVAFRELRKAKEQGHDPKDLYVPGTAYKIAEPGYTVY